MKTIYITGIKKYQISVIMGLEKSDLKEGIDYIQGLNGEDFALVWIDDQLNLKEFKKAIGSKFVWKHRMRFFENIDDMKPKKSDNELTDSDRSLMERILRKEIIVS
jgi:hypothetical protein